MTEIGRSIIWENISGKSHLTQSWGRQPIKNHVRLPRVFWGAPVRKKSKYPLNIVSCESIATRAGIVFLVGFWLEIDLKWFILQLCLNIICWYSVIGFKSSVGYRRLANDGNCTRPWLVVVFPEGATGERWGEKMKTGNQTEEKGGMQNIEYSRGIPLTCSKLPLPVI